MAGNLTFRLFQPDDIEGVLRLWSDDSGWGGITEQQFYDWYMNTPHGECLIAVALDEKNRIVGQEVFTPTRVYVDGAEKKALRFSAPILAKEFSERLGFGSHPTVEMFKVVGAAAIKNGYSLIYAFPARAWLRFAPVFVLPELGKKPGFTAELDCYGFSIKSFVSDERKANDEFEVSLVREYGADYDALWQSAKDSFPIDCAIVRSSGWLKWKLGSHYVLEVRQRDNKELTGYAAFKGDSGLLVDVLARTSKDLETIVTVAIEALYQRGDLINQVSIEEIKMMKTEALVSVIQKLGFSREKFKFAFWCYSIDESVSVEAIQPNQWYLMPND